MGPQSGEPRVRVGPGQLQLDELIERLEALLASDLVVARPEQTAEA